MSPVLMTLLLLLTSAAALAADTSSWWRPNTSTGPVLDWNYQLSTPLAPDGGDYLPGVAVYIVDCFEATADAVAALRARAPAQGTPIRAVGYFSAGSYEEWRPDAGDFAQADLGAPLADWPGERWLNVSSPRVRDIMRARLRMCKAKGFDGVDPDNMNAHANANGAGVTAAKQLEYTRFIAAAARGLGMAVGLKNAADQLPQLLEDVDFFVNEQCHEFDECGAYAPALTAGKPVFVVEYDRDAFDGACRAAAIPKLATIFKNLTLDPCRLACGRSAPECPGGAAGAPATGGGGNGNAATGTGSSGAGLRAGGMLAPLLLALAGVLALLG